MADEIRIGERVQVFLKEDWFEATVVRIEPYSEHRSFYWVEFDEDVQAVLGFNRISIFNPKKMRKKEG
jgi:hypothetical protein